MPHFRLTVLHALAGVLLPSAAFACLWDTDTLLQERTRFPDALELITGKFLRHSSEFYEWRIRDRQQKLQSDPNNLGYYDDLAVAYEKTAQHQKAIETMLAKDQKKPGLYETEANLGTFYLHAGQMEKGLEHIDRALHINPNAHFDREKFQRLLAEYVLARRLNGTTRLPLADVGESGEQGSTTTFSAFVKEKQRIPRLSEQDRTEAVRGVLGMMRFGNHDSPVLLEALGNLLGDSHALPTEDAKRLSARAYLKASYEVSDETAKHAYRDVAGYVLNMQTKNPLLPISQLPLEDLEASFQKELAEARAWYEAVRQDELAWIREGKDPEQEFNRKYYEEPRVATHWKEGLPAMVEANKTLSAIVAGLVLVGLFLLVKKWKSRRRAAALKVLLEGPSRGGLAR